FFFSSRRRHTRFSRDWSSDVCSSDLFMARPGERNGQTVGKQAVGIRVVRDSDQPVSFAYGLVRELAVREVLFAIASGIVFGIPRSEERRVGKEGRSRVSACA